ncbi:hypothetical protein P7K49_035996 [Saguinus oedipus]|uniref:Uncharacterized protein n=1 Tax=Saguinus oedipus TaxID=9490 RepID=A0ABQ9TPK0_SAGOE|nr:hypothetical protein P7K49_035996 [Saguinus oedipus]
MLPAPLQTAQDESSPGLEEHFHNFCYVLAVCGEKLPGLSHRTRENSSELLARAELIRMLQTNLRMEKLHCRVIMLAPFVTSMEN